MSRKGWRAARVFRVFLACLALWLPARSAAASLGPTDVVVMIAGGPAERVAGPRLVNGGVADARMRSNEGAREAAAAARAPGPAPLPSSTRSLRDRREGSAARAAPPPLYLLHCALLR